MNKEVHFYYDKVDISNPNNISYLNPKVIGRVPTEKEGEFAKQLFFNVTIHYSNSSRHNKEIGIGLPIAKEIFEDSAEFTFFEDTFQYARGSEGKTSGSGRQNWIDSWTNYYVDFLPSLERLEIIDLNIRILGDMASTTFIDKSSFQLKGSESATGFRNVTLIWIYREDEKKWRAFHEHATLGKY